MRRLQFPVEWEGGGERLLLSVHTGPSHTAQEFIADAFITRPVGSFLDLLGQWKGAESRFAVRAASRRVLLFDIAHDLVDAPWQVGSILGLIESAVFLQDLEDDPFITGVSVKGAAFAEATTDRPSVISTDKNPAYNEAIAALRREGRLAPHCRHRQVKYLNNRLESDHGKLKQRIRPVRGFQSQKTAHNAIRGFETMRMFRKGQFRSMVDSLAGGSEARFIGRLFQVFVA